MHNPDQLTLLAKLFRGFADRSRLAVLSTLLNGPQCVSAVVAATGLTQPNVSNHLSCLRDCGLVTREQRGLFVFYRLTAPAIAQFLTDAEQLVLSAHGLPECPRYEPLDRPDDAPGERKSGPVGPALNGREASKDALPRRRSGSALVQS